MDYVHICLFCITQHEQNEFGMFSLCFNDSLTFYLIDNFFFDLHIFHCSTKITADAKMLGFHPTFEIC